MKKNIVLVLLGVLYSSLAFSHGDGAPQPVDTKGLEPLGDEWLKENPYKDNALAIEVGASGYNSNCARCHGLEVRSGGIAPDLRYLPADAEGDAWFLNRIRKGYSLNGFTRMPPFEDIMSQEAMWAIRAYIDAQPE